jgi:hypothetical protein
MHRSFRVLALCTVLSSAAPREELVLHVDPARGKDDAPGTSAKPLRSLSAALARLQEPLTSDVTLELAPGRYETTGGVGMPERSLQLDKRMANGAEVRIRRAPGGDEPVVLAWKGERRTLEASSGRWRLEGLQIGSFEPDQVRGLYAHGPVEVRLLDVCFELRSRSDAALWAERGARIALSGAIRVNDRAFTGETPEDSYSGIVATDGGIVEFEDGERSSLVLGNGSLRTSYYGSIRLGCKTAELTCRTRSNVLSIGNSGRIDLRNTRTTLQATDPANTLIGLEHDGHVLAEDAELHLRGKNESAIALQKASTLTCNDVHLEGEFATALWASSGSMFVGRFLGEVHGLEARTGAGIHVEALEGKLVGPVRAKSGGIVSLPERVVDGR